MIDPTKVRGTGPMSGFQDPFSDELRRLGYARSTIVQHLHVMAHLSRWMAREDISDKDVSWPLLRRFCSEQGLTGTRRPVPMVLVLLMEFIRPGSLPTSTASASEGFEDEEARLLAHFLQYLVHERALAGRTEGSSRQPHWRGPQEASVMAHCAGFRNGVQSVEAGAAARGRRHKWPRRRRLQRAAPPRTAPNEAVSANRPLRIRPRPRPWATTGIVMALRSS